MAAFVSAIVLVAAMTGCATAPERNPVPADLTLEAAIPGIPEARFWGDAWPKWSEDEFYTLSEQQLRAEFQAAFGRPHTYLAISGGGANGAFGAGLLVGWSDRDTRPEFTIVTGVSTGALTAPFVFLGRDYDWVLKEVYTTVRTEDIVRKRNLLAAATGDSMADTAPLKALIARYVTSDVLDAVGEQHRRGRRLFIGTANLDAGRPVIWSIGAIANSRHPDRLTLVHDVLRASASIPIAFPPVAIRVEANGRTFDELHVDGGTASQVFVYPAAIDWARVLETLQVPGRPKVYVIRNSFLKPDHEGVKRTLIPIASRSIDSLIRTQGIGDLYQIYALCERDGNDFNLAFIPSDFEQEPSEPFDPVYMSALFERGYQMARGGYPWEKEPPGYLAGR